MTADLKSRAPHRPPGFRVRLDGLTVAAGVCIACFAAIAISADFISDQLLGASPTQVELECVYGPPAPSPPRQWLGCDHIGRSVIARLVHGARTSLGVGAAAAALTSVLGGSLGLFSGYKGGWIDDTVQWAIATLDAVPAIFVLLLFGVLFKPGPEQLVLALSAVAWPGIALFARGQVLSLREREYVTAARASGASDWRVVFHHLLPNVAPLLVILTAMEVGQVILIESTLSYLGLGIQPPTPSWGSMLRDATTTVSLGGWLFWPPGVAVSVTVLCLYILGDGLRDALDPRR